MIMGQTDITIITETCFNSLYAQKRGKGSKEYTSSIYGYESDNPYIIPKETNHQLR